MRTGTMRTGTIIIIELTGLQVRGARCEGR